VPGDYRIENTSGGVIGAIGDGAVGSVTTSALARAADERGAPTVGLLTALPVELRALRQLTDRPRRHTVADDRATYELGLVPSADGHRPHRVVLALAGETANVAAADACTNLLRSFPSVSQIMMVGIAAGVPPVRRGDVVVSTGGVVDYDHVWQGPGGPELRQGFPRPSSLLVRAARDLAADQDGEAWTTVLSRIERPDAGRPRAHHGIVGSADRSLADEAVRDRLAARHQLVALEMEGAGIGRASHLNGLEWLVVRGVSDLAEADRDDSWHRYAALVAAAYTRALLGRCPPLSARGGRPLAGP
jgi:nucleoside phosphorylase